MAVKKSTRVILGGYFVGLASILLALLEVAEAGTGLQPVVVATAAGCVLTLLATLVLSAVGKLHLLGPGAPAVAGGGVGLTAYLLVMGAPGSTKAVLLALGAGACVASSLTWPLVDRASRDPD